MLKLRTNLAAILLLTALILTSCGNSNEAARRLEEAKQMYDSKLFIAAKSAIDSINQLFPREVEIRREALTLMRLVERGEREQNIAYCDSLLPIRESELTKLKIGFVFEKDTVYDEKGNYIWKTMTVERNIERSYIRYGVNEDGEMYMASVYFGSRPLEHTGLKLSINSGVFAETPAIAYDGGLNYRFKDLGNITEVVTYKGENCKMIANFVYNLPEKERVKAEYTGGKAFALYLSDNDKKAIRATYELALTLSEITAMKIEKTNAEKIILLIDSKLNK
ncbi:MAG: hypothetical protein LBS80_05690 [Tannerella sp.]|jgi:hypothetical protein|nr:hypothetical protein [Tannerella sp.]